MTGRLSSLCRNDDLDRELTAARPYGYRLSRPGDADYTGSAGESANRAANTVVVAASAYHESRSGGAVSADRAKEYGAFATPNGRPRQAQDAPAGVGVKATPLRGRPTGRGMTPQPGAVSSGGGTSPLEQRC
jgi:hypothetical protein